ncbi:MAG TPA: M67 family metallopeptidase [Thermomicrobiales bacterium]|nr:M67 family metallopeptidase [Thermomicrobiales bacterium]
MPGGDREGGEQDRWEPSPPAGLRLDRRLHRAILEHVMAAAPSEAVALLAVEPYAAGAPARAVKLYPGTNLDDSATRYTMDPTEVISAFDDIDARGWWLGAIVHSHPATPPVPSATDLHEAYYPDALSIIVSLTTEPPTVRAWQMEPRTKSREVPLVIEGEIPGAEPPAGETPRSAVRGIDARQQ